MTAKTPSTTHKGLKGGRKPREGLDWDRIEADYRAGTKTIREIAGEHGITHSAILQQAKAKGWERNLRERVQARADRLLTIEVTKRVKTGRSLVSKATEDEVVAANARAIADVVLGHREHAGRALTLVRGLFDELGAIGDHLPDFHRAYELLTTTPADGEELSAAEKKAIWSAIQRATGLEGRAGIAKTLADALGKLVAIERQAFNLDAGVPEPPDPGKEQRAAKALFDNFEAGIETMRKKFQERLGTVAPPASQLVEQVQQ